MKRNRKATHIQWDVDEPEDMESLPTEIDIPDGMTDIEVFTFSVVYRHMELGKPLTGAFTIVGLTKKMDALRKARHLL